MVLKNTSREIEATWNTGSSGRNLIGAFLILFISLWMIDTVLVPEILEIFDQAGRSHTIAGWAAALGAALILLFLVAFPIYLIVQGYVNYHEARILDRKGVKIGAYIIDKWVDDSGWWHVYYVQYRYQERINVVETVTKKVFQCVKPGQSIKVLILERIPHMLRICPEFPP